MGQRAFDKKFGAELVVNLAAGPGVYLFRDAAQAVLYVGKAKNIRRRLQNYRNASRKRVHRKMRTLVREASSVEIRPQDTERDALLHENALIRELRPPYNVDGAFAFLYPAVGVARRDAHTLLCFSTKPEDYAGLELDWYGCFRSRPRAKEAFDALVELLALIGHLEKRTKLPPPSPRARLATGGPAAAATGAGGWAVALLRRRAPRAAADPVDRSARQTQGETGCTPGAGVPAATGALLRAGYQPAARGDGQAASPGHLHPAGRAGRAVHLGPV